MVGDPRFLLHPVEAIGQLIQFLKRKFELIAGQNTFLLRLGGIFITLFVITLSCGSGWIIEQFFLKGHYLLIPNQIRFIALVIALASSLAAKSLSKSAIKVINSLNDSPSPNENLSFARKELSINVRAGGTVNIHSKTKKIIENKLAGGTINYLYEEGGL